MIPDGELATIEVLLKPTSAPPRPGAPPRPDPEAIERLRRAWTARGLTCHSTPFGLVCTAPRAVLARLLGTEALSAGPGASLPAPADVADLVEQITVSVPPEFFG